MSNTQNVTLVIPNYNGSNYLSDCLNSLVNQSYKNYKVIIVDNASTDRSIQFIKDNFPQFSLIENKTNAGFSKAVNQASRSISDGLIVIINNDIVLDPRWLEELINFSNIHPDFGACQSKILLYGTDKVNTAGNEIFFLGHGWSGGYGNPGDMYTAIKEVTYCSGASMMIKKEVLDRVGYFDDEEVFMYHDDLDIGWRLLLLGYKNYLAPGSVIYHKYQYNRNVKKFYYLEISRFVCIIKYYRLKTILLLMPAMLLMELATLLFSLKQGWFKDKLKTYTYVLFNLKRLLRKRNAIQKQRKVSDKEVMDHFVGSIVFPELDSPLLKVANGFFRAYFWFIKMFV